ncbi:enoyl-CoA hydratase/isomerase family protein [Nocardioides jishulii]|uniref:Enoyl-CoA hydratase/isomerase family protein n=1 Tax=Nocardioides jishulii TaxID=2575440 RepID=A0A4U2YN82_9ACTN|nr:enoyl-CoA hydratase/isomerase family protein [Nocardioides jishulii]QCX27931.1 enoyl-CoA hydratase/isomerase family protein [Nocardioides jishulii]TKI62737.1 enoyl-CoA hydratase/isomerase family protein [Nocardioides jishulii]
MTSSFQGYSVTVDGGLVHLRLDGNEANALGAARYEGITRVASEATEEQVLLLTAAGDSFSAGQNLREYVAAQVQGELTELLTVGTDAVLALLECRATVVAAVQGPAVGGGALLAGAADLVLLSPHARLRLPELELGMPLGASVLERLVGSAAARRMALTGAWVEAREVACLGGARLVAADTLEHEARDLCAQLLAADGRVRAIARRLFSGDERARAAALYRAEVAATIELLG